MLVKPVLVVLAHFAAMTVARAACPPDLPALPRVAIAALGEHGDPRLADGRRLRLIGIAPPADAAARSRFAAGLAPWLGRELALEAVGAPDRWGRQPARLFSVPDGAGLAEALLATAAATRLAEPAFTPCGTAQPGAAPPALDGHDLAALRGQAGRYVVLEGRIASVGERARRTYLNFSRRRGEAAAISLSKPLWRVMQERGWNGQALLGKRVRARGILAGADGALLEVTTPSGLELID